jgi:hypothetical protein
MEDEVIPTPSRGRACPAKRGVGERFSLQTKRAGKYNNCPLSYRIYSKFITSNPSSEQDLG